jgi:signal transduction histidine kinase
MAGVLLAVVIVSVGLMALLINQSTAYQFDRYVSGMMGGRGMAGMMGNSANSPAAQAEFLSTVSRSLWIAGLAAVAVAAIAGVLLTRQITRPIRALTAGARQISKGNLDHRVVSSSGDEVGELVQSFNSMAAALEQSEQSRRRMTADIAHELRTPLTIIEGTVDAMLDGVFPCDRERLASVKEQTAMLTRLIGDLRDLSLAESGQLKLELTREDLVDLVRRKIAQFEAAATEHGLELKLDPGGPVPKLEIDRVRMEQVVVNLLANAIRHTPRGGRITVSIVPAEPGGAVISVADTGGGIAPEHLPHIFERFYRVSDSRARSEGGTGLGLAIVKHLVQAHGGRVRAESAPGKGSTFFVQLPAKETRL